MMDFFEKKRQTPRVKKAFYITYYEENNPGAFKELSQLRDLSIGGLCFTTAHPFAPGTALYMELNLPYLHQTLTLEGKVKSSLEKVSHSVYENHVEFFNLSRETKNALDKMIRDFSQEELIQERRQYLRINKNFIVRYFEAENPTEKHEVTQLKNISRGGMCLVTSQYFAPAVRLTIELKVPHFSDMVLLEGSVLQSHEKIKNIIYETRVQFINISPQGAAALDKIISFLQVEMKKNRKEE